MPSPPSLRNAPCFGYPDPSPAAACTDLVNVVNAILPTVLQHRGQLHGCHHAKYGVPQLPASIIQLPQHTHKLPSHRPCLTWTRPRQQHAGGGRLMGTPTSVHGCGPGKSPGQAPLRQLGAPTSLLQASRNAEPIALACALTTQQQHNSHGHCLRQACRGATEKKMQKKENPFRAAPIIVPRCKCPSACAWWLAWDGWFHGQDRVVALVLFCGGSGPTCARATSLLTELTERFARWLARMDRS